MLQQGTLSCHVRFLPPRGREGGAPRGTGSRLWAVGERIEQHPGHEAPGLRIPTSRTPRIISLWVGIASRKAAPLAAPCPGRPPSRAQQSFEERLWGADEARMLAWLDLVVPACGVPRAGAKAAGARRRKAF